MGLLPVWMMAPFPIAPVEEKSYETRGKRSRIKERSDAIIEMSPSICIKCLPVELLPSAVSLILTGIDGWGAVSLSPGWVQSVTLSISLRFTGSPCTPKPHPAPRHVFQRGTRTARVNLNLILTGMFLAERHGKVFLELSPHSNLWA